MEKKIEVFAHWVPLSEPKKVGLLKVNVTRGKEVYSFEYDSTYLTSGLAVALDPGLLLVSGPQHASGSGPFGVLLDSSPDRWGRKLMERRLARQIKAGEVESGTRLFESDYLLGVHDLTRMGGLRFRMEGGEHFLDYSSGDGVPPLTKLRELEAYSRLIDGEDSPEALALGDANFSLLALAGLSLGGARPKVNVTDRDGGIWIAKFPKSSDDVDVGAWEMVLNELAATCGIRVPRAYIKKFASNQHTLLSRRFDRTSSAERVHFCSALTMLSRKDGYGGADGGSYLELGEWIMKNGCRVDQTLKELWRRIVFSVCTANTDDHLRNHGFLLSPEGWVLSPAYDMNPNRMGQHLALNIDELSSELDLKLCLDVAKFFHLSAEESLFIMTDIKEKVKSSWRLLAKKCGITAKELDLVAPAFSVSERLFM